MKNEFFKPTIRGFFTNPLYFLRKSLVSAISEHATMISGDVLDFGCGEKPYETLFRKATSYVGVDIEVSGHDHAGSKVDVFWDGQRLPFPDASFDAVVAFEVFEHIPVSKTHQTISEIRRVLKKGGTLLMSTPFLFPEHEKPYDFVRYTSFGLVDLLETNGFRLQKIVKTPSPVETIAQIVTIRIRSLPQGVTFFSWLMRSAQCLVVNIIAVATRRINARNDSSDLYLNLVAVSVKL